MLPLLPFLAGVAAGAFAVNALRRSDVQGGIQRARRAVREAADASMQRARRRSAQWCERWCRTDGDADAPEAEDIEMVDASGDACDDDAPRRRSIRRGGRRRAHREEPERSPDAEDNAAEDSTPAAEADGGSEASERA
ncbi:MAG: hypothetical protein IJR28_05905 [Ottowia sp.]|nr:hypothetical protein [Ottowia sp.]